MLILTTRRCLDPRLLKEVGDLLEAHRVAGTFAAEQINTEKSKQVYLNTLSVYAVHRYLKWLGIETDLSQGDCWNPILRNRWNVADLVIPNIGKVECCPVLPGETTISVSPEATEERIGYLVVQFTEDLDQVQLLGFTKTVIAGIIEISQLRSLDEFIDVISPQTVNLENWFAAIFDEVWQPIETLFNPQQLAFNPRNLAFKGFKKDDSEEIISSQEIIERVKEINLGLLANSQQLNLVVSIRKEENQEIGCLFQVYPMNMEEYLPVGLKLKVILESDEAEKKVEPGETKKFLKIRLTELPGKLITVQIHLDNEYVTEQLIF
ncbi:MAG: DUF1822 family protein [Calothrix sp. MO_192.B10]|nr:DUF1822 family protein [Calothrix sp. MO_192.B10]